MAQSTIKTGERSGDGTSQSARYQPALEPEYVSVDERELEDLLSFAREYAKELNYYDENNVQHGDWSSFIHPDIDLAEVAEYVRNPDKIPLDKIHEYTRPHLALYLSFLQILGHARNDLNRFTRRHLEFYYQNILIMTKKSAVSDQVNVLLRPTPAVDSIEVPKGHSLAAGRDSLGRDLLYATDNRILVNHARIERLSATYAERQVVGIKEARENHKGTRKEAFINMLKVVLGDPLPGDPFPDYEPDRPPDYNLLLKLESLVNFTSMVLFLPFFELRTLMRFKHQRDNADEDWEKINTWLETAGKNNPETPDFVLNPDDPRDFNANLIKAIGSKPGFGGLTQVENIDDLYFQRSRDDVKAFIEKVLFFKVFKDFEDMMLVKTRIDSEWNEINRILELGGKRKRDDDYYRLEQEGESDFNPVDFAVNLDAALGPLDFSVVGTGNIDGWYKAFLQVEAYFFMSAEHFSFAMEIEIKTGESDKQKAGWKRVYEILAGAYRKRIYHQRRVKLQHVFEGSPNMSDGYRAMLYFALGIENAESEDDSPLERLRDAISSSEDFMFLESTQTGIDNGDTAKIDWEKVYRALEIAQRNFENLSEPVARIKRWINLHAYADVTTTTPTGLLTSEDPANTRWKTFGGIPVKAIENEPPGENTGWAISSPLLQMGSGTLQIELTLGFDTETCDLDKIEPLFSTKITTGLDDTGPFRVQVSSKDEWLTPDSIEVKFGEYTTLTGISDDSFTSLIGINIILEFSQQVEPVVAPSGELSDIHSVWPVLRLMLRQQWDSETAQHRTHYSSFETLQLVVMNLKVKVGSGGATGPASGLNDVRIQNDQAVLNSKKPFHPFGTSPVAGARFYMGHPELTCKRLDSLMFRIEWMGVPKDLVSHYNNYPASDSEWKFSTHVSLVNKRVSYTLNSSARLFANTDATSIHNINITNVAAALKNGNADFTYSRSLESAAGDEPLNWTRYLQWELSPLDFQHQAFPGVSANNAVDMAASIATTPDSFDASLYKINPPYTPKIKMLDIHYTASVSLDLRNERTVQGDDEVFHIHPFGSSRIQTARSMAGCYFLPEYRDEGELFLGISGVKSPQPLSVLFQMAEGSANPEREPVSVKWSYLSGDRWHRFEGRSIRKDTTRGLINTGIIEFELPEIENGTRMPENYYWIRAGIPYHSDSVCDTVAIHAQAVSATLIDTQYAPDHYLQPLPENSIKKLYPSIPGIAELLQPYTSYNGKAAEQDSVFYTRVSERLRHKQRALTIWDYERIVLEEFPQIFKAKCLPAKIAGNSDDVGKVRLVVIPDVRKRLPFDPFGPKASANLIADIESSISKKISPYARVEVINAHYVPVKVRIGVRFQAGYDTGFYTERLNEDLNHFLSPWAYEEGADIIIGGRIYANSIVNFLDQRDYVDYVAEIKLFSSEDGQSFHLAKPVDDQGYFVSTDAPDGVLVAAQEHEIDVITEGAYQDELFTGINYMKIELDFIVE